MDFFKSILQSLPLEKISDILGEIVIWWSQMVKGVPPADLPMYAYLGGAIIVLILWLLVARMLPKPLGGMSWMILFAVLLAPGTALSDPSSIAPASISVVYAIMMKDTAGAISNALPVLVVLVVGLFIGFVWQLIRGAFESSLNKARLRTAADTQATMQLTTGSYLLDDAMIENEPVPAKEKKLAPFAMLKRKANKKADLAPNSPDPAENESNPDTVIDIAPSIATLKQDSLVKKPVEGFYSKKPIDPIVVVENDNEDD